MDLLSTWLASTPLTAHTQRAYRTEVGRLLSYTTGRNIPLGALEASQLNRFWKQLLSGRLHQVDATPSPGSLQQSRRILSAFLRWCVTQKQASVDLLAELDRWVVPAQTTSSKATRARRAAPPVSRLVRARNLDEAAAALSFWTGASPSELASLEIAALDWTQSQVKIARHQSFSAVALPDELTTDLRTLASDGRTYLFGRSQPPSAGAVAQRISRWATNQRVASTSARRLRSRFLDLAKQAGWSSDEIRGQLRRLNLPLDTPQAPLADRLAAIERTALKKRPPPGGGG